MRYFINRISIIWRLQARSSFCSRAFTPLGRLGKASARQPGQLLAALLPDSLLWALRSALPGAAAVAATWSGRGAGSG